ncbi:uncharacterized protein STEHIDRAFT_120247 [Stereum hirsutum FP-91666 SS1]|uniref:uncharacterized protein n=1 Tax=Stereum hirsutum (strain FP-91666) TaxID=721885 RepID=UPI000440E344|nr:uncharacterized protein STEHIDRAFT_120247 [Stereum hirsutum FP-91666 SS1]EIM88033.1 hypothetical protein STEHIDRAFT_120247 [Stereum hirsutum FP-91666 SS1]
MELFEGNRKTCRLSHDRLGARDMELSVWEVPGDVEGKEEWPAVVDACESLWKDHYMARLGTPEVLEHSSSLRTFKDIEEKCMKRGYLGRKVWEEGPMTPNTRIYTALTWAKTRARRDKSAADWTKSSSEEKSMDKWIAFNTRWGDTLMPPNAILCAQWFCEWNIRDRTLIFLSATPFDRQEVQDRAAFSINATRMRVFTDIEKHNREFPDDPWGHPLHIWTSLKYTVEPLRSRIIDIIQVKFQSLPLEEYLLRYPDTDRALFSATHTTIGRVANEHPSADEQDRGLDVYVRHWGSDANVDALSKQMEGMLARKPRAYAES